MRKIDARDELIEGVPDAPLLEQSATSTLVIVVAGSRGRAGVRPRLFGGGPHGRRPNRVYVSSVEWCRERRSDGRRDRRVAVGEEELGRHRANKVGEIRRQVDEQIVDGDGPEELGAANDRQPAHGMRAEEGERRMEIARRRRSSRPARSSPRRSGHRPADRERAPDAPDHDR